MPPSLRLDAPGEFSAFSASAASSTMHQNPAVVHEKIIRAKLAPNFREAHSARVLR